VQSPDLSLPVQFKLIDRGQVPVEQFQNWKTNNAKIIISKSKESRSKGKKKTEWGV
jgi:hypothetical protein